MSKLEQSPTSELILVALGAMAEAEGREVTGKFPPNWGNYREGNFRHSQNYGSCSGFLATTQVE